MPRVTDDSFFETPPIDARWVASGLRMRILAPLAIGLVMLAFGIAVILSVTRERLIEVDGVRDVKAVVEVFEERRAIAVQNLLTFLELVMKDRRLGSALQAGDRRGLLELSAPIFESLRKKNGISHLDYVSLDGTKLLQMSDPYRYGDKFRLNQLEAGRGTPYSGNYVDALGDLTLQVVYPWYVEEKLVGHVVLGVKVEDLLRDVKKTLGADIFIAIDKAAIEKAGIDVAQANAIQKQKQNPVRWDDFPDMVVVSATRQDTPPSVRAYLESVPEARGTRDFEGAANGRVTRTIPAPFTDRPGGLRGVMLVMLDITNAVDQRDAAVMRILLLCSGLGGILLVIFYALLGRAELDVSQRTALLDEAHNTLVTEQHERQRTQVELGVQQERNDLLEARSRMVDQLAAAHLAAQEALHQNEEITVQLRETQSELVATARQAGRAEIAINVLHNVGNVLNSVNVSAGVIGSALRQSRLPSLERALGLMEEHTADLGTYLATDEKGRLLPGYLGAVAKALSQEQASMSEELQRLNKNIEHIKEIVATQQSHAGGMSVIEPVKPSDLAEDALRLQETALARHKVKVIREFEPVPTLPLDRGRVLQILVNLISNAKSAMAAFGDSGHRLTLRVELVGPARLRISVRDDGEGIPQHSLTRIFSHGFTTRKTGHGFGLHSSALAATEMGGTLTVASEGPGKGATFTLELPIDPPRAAA